MFVNALHPEVAELQGLYGPLQILEGKVQEVWALQGLLPGKWQTIEGKRLRVRSPGRWNRGAGPDFREAVIELDGEVLVGDVEIHLYREDWWRHGHHLDPGYDRVLLHVVLFAGGMKRAVRTSSGIVPEEWIMGPWMREDLESISGGEPGLFGELVPELKEWMESDTPEVIRSRLSVGADRRWEAKESMARCLHEAAGWEGGLHRMVLYYLGFPYNRRPFFEMAERYPRREWSDPAILGSVREEWDTQVRWGLGRPANQALARLRQYVHLNQASCNWTVLLRQLPESLLQSLSVVLESGLLEGGTRAVRRSGQYRQWQKWLSETVLGSVLSRSLVDRLWVDVFLPMLVVEERLSRESACLLWNHWEAANYPDAYPDLLKLADIQIDRFYPLSNGWVQGMFWLEDQIRVEGVRRAIG